MNSRLKADVYKRQSYDVAVFLQHNGPINDKGLAYYRWDKSPKVGKNISNEIIFELNAVLGNISNYVIRTYETWFSEGLGTGWERNTHYNRQLFFRMKTTNHNYNNAPLAKQRSVGLKQVLDNAQIFTKL